MGSAFLRGFGAGLVRFSGLSTWLTVATAGIVCGLLLFSSEFLVRTLAFYPGVAWVDDNSYGYMRAVESGRRNSANTVYIVGASTMRETLMSERAMEERLSSALGEEMRVVDLTTTGQPFWFGEDLAMRAACGDEAGVLFLAVNLTRTRHSPDGHARDRINVPSAAPESLLAAAKGKAEFAKAILVKRTKADMRYLRRYAAYAVGRGRKPEARPLYTHDGGRHRYVRTNISDEERSKRTAKVLRQLEKNKWAYAGEFSDSVSSFIEKLQACSGVEIVLVETPINPEILASDTVRQARSEHLAKMADLAERMNVHFLSLPDAVGYEVRDFYDHGHLMTRDSFERTTNVMADFAATLLRGRTVALRGKEE